MARGHDDGDLKGVHRSTCAKKKRQHRLAHETENTTEDIAQREYAAGAHDIGVRAFLFCSLSFAGRG